MVSAPPVPRVSFVCVTRNRAELLAKCLQSCLEQDYGAVELVVVDNASTDGTAERVRREFPEARLISTHRNLGFFPALNLAIANSSGAYVMTVDDDAYFLDRRVVARMVAEFERDAAVGGVTCNIVGPHEEPLAAADRPVPGFKTGFTMLKREVFTDWVGYYPDAFFRSGGEQYVASILWDMGLSIRQLADAKMYHARTLTGRSTWDWTFYGYRSQILVSLMRDPWYLIPPRLAGKCCRTLLHSIRTRRLLAWLAVWLNVWLWVPYALRLRRPVRWETQRRLWALRRPPDSSQ